MAIKTNIKSTNISLTPAVLEYVTKKVDALEKFIGKEDESAKANVEVGKTTSHHKTGDLYRAEINLHVAGKNLRAVAEKENLYAAIDTVKVEMTQEINSHKARKQTIEKRGGRKLKDLLRGLKW